MGQGLRIAHDAHTLAAMSGGGVDLDRMPFDFEGLGQSVLTGGVGAALDGGRPY